VTQNFVPTYSGSTSEARFPVPSSSRRGALAPRKAQLIRRREVNQVLKLFNAFKRDEGQTMAEYGVVLSVITIAVVTAIALLSSGIVDAITRVAGVVK